MHFSACSIFRCSQFLPEYKTTMLSKTSCHTTPKLCNHVRYMWRMDVHHQAEFLSWQATVVPGTLPRNCCIYCGCDVLETYFFWNILCYVDPMQTPCITFMLLNHPVLRMCFRNILYGVYISVPIIYRMLFISVVRTVISKKKTKIYIYIWLFLLWFIPFYFTHGDCHNPFRTFLPQAPISAVGYTLYAYQVLAVSQQAKYPAHILTVQCTQQLKSSSASVHYKLENDRRWTG